MGGAFAIEYAFINAALVRSERSDTIELSDWIAYCNVQHARFHLCNLCSALQGSLLHDNYSILVEAGITRCGTDTGPIPFEVGSGGSTECTSEERTQNAVVARRTSLQSIRLPSCAL